jgi:hypothetical protein
MGGGEEWVYVRVGAVGKQRWVWVCGGVAFCVRLAKQTAEP